MLSSAILSSEVLTHALEQTQGKLRRLLERLPHTATLLQILHGQCVIEHILSKLGDVLQGGSGTGLRRWRPCCLRTAVVVADDVHVDLGVGNSRYQIYADLIRRAF